MSREIKLYFLGISSGGYEVYPKTELEELLHQYIDEGFDQDWRLYISQSKDVVRYTYVRHQIHTPAEQLEKKGVFGISLHITGYYIKNVESGLLQFFHDTFQTLAKDIQLFKTENGEVYYMAERISHSSHYLDEQSKTIKSYYDDYFLKQLEPLKTNLKNVKASKRTFISSNSANNETINKEFKKNGACIIQERIIESPKTHKLIKTILYTLLLIILFSLGIGIYQLSKLKLQPATSYIPLKKVKPYIKGTTVFRAVYAGSTIGLNISEFDTIQKTFKFAFSSSTIKKINGIKGKGEIIKDTILLLQNFDPQLYDQFNDFRDSLYLCRDSNSKQKIVSKNKKINLI